MRCLLTALFAFGIVTLPVGCGGAPPQDVESEPELTADFDPSDNPNMGDGIAVGDAEKQK